MNCIRFFPLIITSKSMNKDFSKKINLIYILFFFLYISFHQIGISNSELSFNSPLLGGRQKFSCVPPGKGAAPDLQGVGTGSTGEDQTGSTWQPCQEGAQCINKSQVCGMTFVREAPTIESDRQISSFWLN